MTDEQRVDFDRHIAAGSGDSHDTDTTARRAYALAYGES